MKIFIISIGAFQKGINGHEGEHEASKTKTGYKVSKQSNFGGKTTLVKDTEILKVDSMTNNHNRQVSFYTWYLEGQEVIAKKIITEALIEKVKDIKNEADTLFFHIKTLQP